MSKWLNCPNIPQEIPIPLNLVVYFIKASISHSQKKFIKWCRTFWPSFFITHQQQFSNPLVDQSLPSFPPLSLFSHEVHGWHCGPRKIDNRPFHLQEIQNLDSPRQATENCTAINWLSFNLSSRIYSFLFSYNDSYSEMLCLAVHFCCLGYRNIICVVSEWTGFLTGKNITQMSERNEIT